MPKARLGYRVYEIPFYRSSVPYISHVHTTRSAGYFVTGEYAPLITAQTALYLLAKGHFSTQIRKIIAISRRV